ncbi:hypothetical protein HNR21_001144 [Actinomadura cellulosilytica]|uniref:Uncharacterized protein n=1 Tax=Thermomonospora cellulosilytica TaxID=1411118 RepID=A0A7W3MUN8_9ACTN|nr:hypothetical protein [Thermomonospora cellulosilytica]
MEQLPVLRVREALEAHIKVMLEDGCTRVS